MITYTLKVIDLRKETFDTTTVCFKQPLLKKIKYHAGQYLTLIFKINGRRYLRPYSFSSCQGVDPYIEITIKRVHGGIVSNHICDKVRVGDVIEVMEPMGDFVVNEQMLAGNCHFILWGAGSGITPLISIAKYILSLGSGRKVTLVYGNRNHESAIFLEQIRLLQSSYSEIFSVCHFHTQLFVKDEYPNIVQGRIQPNKVLSVVQAEGDILHSYHFICGPSGLKESVKTSLAYLKVPSENIFSEDFEMIKDERQFEGIITRQVFICKENEYTAVEVVKGKSILEAGLDALIELNYSCQTGNCTVCKGKVVKGKVKHIGLKKEPHELDKDDYLLCCTYPETDDVVVIV